MAPIFTFLDADDKIDSNYLEILFHNCMGTDIAVCDVAVYKEDTEISRFTGGNQKNNADTGIE